MQQSFLITLLYLFALIAPFLIVAVWKKQPVFSFIVAILAFVALKIIPSSIAAFRIMSIYGNADPEIFAEVIARKITSTLLLLIIMVPLLLLFQNFIRKRYKAKLKQAESRALFD